MIKPQQLSKEEYMSMRMYAPEAFLKGIKPSLYLTIHESTEGMEEVHQYSHIPIPLVDREGTLYFRNEAMKDLFLAEIQQVGEDSKEAEGILGTYLGFPPKAVDFFVNRLNRFNRCHSIGMFYAGISFVAHIDDLEENIEWLWNTYQNELPVWVSGTILWRKDALINFGFLTAIKKRYRKLESISKTLFVGISNI